MRKSIGVPAGPTVPASGGVHIPGTSSDDTISDLLGSGSGAPAQPPVPPKQLNLFPRLPHPTVLLFRFTTIFYNNIDCDEFSAPKMYRITLHPSNAHLID